MIYTYLVDEILAPRCVGAREFNNDSTRCRCVHSSCFTNDSVKGIHEYKEVVQNCVLYWQLYFYIIISLIIFALIFSTYFLATMYSSSMGIHSRPATVTLLRISVYVVPKFDPVIVMGVFPSKGPVRGCTYEDIIRLSSRVQDTIISSWF